MTAPLGIKRHVSKLSYVNKAKSVILCAFIPFYDDVIFA